MATPDRTREVRGPTGWVFFAGAVMVIVGFLNFFYGLAAIVNDDVVVVGGHGAIIADLTTWGWITLIIAVVLVLTGFGLFVGAEWARVVGVIIVALNAIEQVWIFPAAPLWAFIVILLDVIIIYNLTARWSEPV
jgi:magnesium-transporting ATPase (P-type)